MQVLRVWGRFFTAGGRQKVSPAAASTEPEAIVPSSSASSGSKAIAQPPPPDPVKANVPASEAATIVPLCLQSCLVSAGVQESQAAYVADVLQPLFEEMLGEVIFYHPDNPASFLLTWLFRRLAPGMPEHVTSPFFRWVAAGGPQGCNNTDAAPPANIRQSEASVWDNHEDDSAARHSSLPMSELWNEDDYRLAEEISPISQKAGIASPTEEPGTVSVVGGLPFLKPLKNPKGSRGSANSRGSQGTPNRKVSFGNGEDTDATVRNLSTSAERGSAIGGERGSTSSMCSMMSEQERRGTGNWKARNQAVGRRQSAFPGVQSLLDAEKAVEYLLKVPMFKEFARDELREVASSLECAFFDADQEVVRWGQQGGDLHFVISGQCKTEVPQKTSELAVGDYFGDQMLMKQHIASEERIVATGGPVITMRLTSDVLATLDIHKKLKRKKNKKAIGKARVQNTQTFSSSVGCDDIIPARGESLHWESEGPSPSSPSSRLIQEDFDMEKTPEDILLIVDAVREDPQLMDVLDLTDEQIEMIAQEVSALVVPSGVSLIMEDEVSDCLYIVQDGMFDVIEDGKVARKLRNGQCVGELGLLYSAPSPNTVTATRQSKAWRLCHDSFRRVMQSKSQKTLEQHVALIRNIGLFNTLGEMDQEVLADALEEVFFVKKEEVLAAGAEVEKLFIIFDGTFSVGDGLARKHLGEGDVFGLEEMVLKMKIEGRVLVSSETACVLTLERDALELLTGMTVSDLAEHEATRKGSTIGDLPNLGGRGGGQRGSSNRKVRDSVAMLQDRQKLEMTQIPRSRLNRIGILGAGSFGLVSLEEDKKTGIWYALKAISKGFIEQQGMQESTVSEKNINMMLNSPFIVKLYNTYKDDQFVYFLLQPAMGGEVFDLYQDHEDWFGNTEFAMFFSAAAALGLEHLHSKKIIYRDLKMENILVDVKGYPLIADMGLAKIVLGKTFTVCGTADYMAPETLRRTGHGRAVDWWALGILIFILMSGRSPFDAKEASQIYRNIVKGLKPEHFPESFNKDLREVIVGLCRKKPEERIPMGPRGLTHLQEAPWFKNFNWIAMSSREIPVMWTPQQPDRQEIANRKVEEPTVIDCSDQIHWWDADF